MAWRYECDDCTWRSTWVDRFDAERIQGQHWRDAHSGKPSTHERFVRDNDGRGIESPRQMVFIAAVLALAFLYAIWEKLT